MAEVVVLYKTPKDAAAFDKYYAETHIPLAKKIPGLKKYAISTGPVGTPSGPSGVHLVAILTFDSVADIQAGFASPEGRAAGGDVPKFASGGADLLIFDTKVV
ncbi:EthD family reductase [Bradyrhizobium sp. Ec3.3]|uniref:EthD family reductase n=1 Tax=Bradyrhizobium sp. Ec3.3 TaxID=189753 RepID=UPI00042463A0|nr:EthD family reductase [Bradyrhizobium sp. Ec3.3]